MISAASRNRAALTEIALYISAYIAYLVTRGLVHDDTRAVGLVNGERVVSLQRDLGFLWEPDWQIWALENAQALVVTMNWIYIITYWPVIFVAALVLFLKSRSDYNFYRSVVFVNLAGALFTFMMFPVASPFAISSVELVDSIQELGPKFYGSESMAVYYNISEAMPSLHFSWTVILGVLFWRSFPGVFRILGLVYPVLTFFSITLTGNHFILDVLAGGTMVVLSFGVVWVVKRRLAAS